MNMNFIHPADQLVMMMDRIYSYGMTTTSGGNLSIKELPEEIEKRSFEIIGEELQERGISLPKDQEVITKRVIHTTADFDYVKTLTYSKDAPAVLKGLTYSREFGGEQEKQAFIDYCLAQSAYDTGVVPTPEDSILTLSTCTGRGNNTTRWVVQALLEPEPPAEEGADQSEGEVDQP